MRVRLNPLLLCGALIVLVSWCPAQKPPDEERRIRLGITTDQQRQLETALSDADSRRKAIQSRLHSLYHDLHELYESYKFDKQQAQSLREQIVAQHQQMLVVFADTELKLRSILNPKQFEKLRAEMKAKMEKRRMMRSQPDFKGWRGDHGPGRPEGTESPAPQGISTRKG
jgi:hypothetical protein